MQATGAGFRIAVPGSESPHGTDDSMQLREFSTTLHKIESTDCQQSFPTKLLTPESYFLFCSQQRDLRFWWPTLCSSSRLNAPNEDGVWLVR